MQKLLARLKRTVFTHPFSETATAPVPSLRSFFRTLRRNWLAPVALTGLLAVPAPQAPDTASTHTHDTGSKVVQTLKTLFDGSVYPAGAPLAILGGQYGGWIYGPVGQDTVTPAHPDDTTSDANAGHGATAGQQDNPYMTGPNAVTGIPELDNPTVSANAPDDTARPGNTGNQTESADTDTEDHASTAFISDLDRIVSQGDHEGLRQSWSRYVNSENILVQAQAMKDVGFYLLHGYRGAPQDVQAAYGAFNLAADMGNIQAQRDLVMLDAGPLTRFENAGTGQSASSAAGSNNSPAAQEGSRDTTDQTTQVVKPGQKPDIVTGVNEVSTSLSLPGSSYPDAAVKKLLTKINNYVSAADNDRLEQEWLRLQKATSSDVKAAALKEIGYIAYNGHDGALKNNYAAVYAYTLAADLGHARAKKDLAYITKISGIDAPQEQTQPANDAAAAPSLPPIEPAVEVAEPPKVVPLQSESGHDDGPNEAEARTSGEAAAADASGPDTRDSQAQNTERPQAEEQATSEQTAEDRAADRKDGILQALDDIAQSSGHTALLEAMDRYENAENDTVRGQALKDMGYYLIKGRYGAPIEYDLAVESYKLAADLGNKQSKRDLEIIKTGVFKREHDKLVEKTRKPEEITSCKITLQDAFTDGKGPTCQPFNRTRAHPGDYLNLNFAGTEHRMEWQEGQGSIRAVEFAKLVFENTLPHLREMFRGQAAAVAEPSPEAPKKQKTFLGMPVEYDYPQDRKFG